MAFLRQTSCRSTLVFILIALFDVALARSQSHPQTRSLPQEASGILEDGTLNCETDRSSDYYGLGVRMGVYFAWFQAWIANVAVPSEIASAQDTNAVFLFATLLSMVRCTITGLLWQMDGLILMHIGGGTIFSVCSIWGYRTCTYDIHGPVEGVRRFGGWGTHFRLLLSMGVSVYGLYFWAWGITGHLDFDEVSGCEVVYTFMFSKIRADGPIRVFYIIICAGCMIYFGCMLSASLIVAPDRVRRIFVARKEGDSGARMRHRFATGLTQKQLRQVFYFLRIGNLLFIIYSMLLIEFSLNYNSVANVLGYRGHIFFPSQIIPTIIGAFGFCKVIWVRYREWKAPDYLHSTTKRTIMRPNVSELKRFYTPKSNISNESANHRADSDMDPLMHGEPTWLRMLVSWLPWLGALRWWKPDSSVSNGSDSAHAGGGGHAAKDEEKSPEGPTLNHASTWSSDTTPQLGGPTHRGTWQSDNTIVGRTELPEIPKGVAKFGDLDGYTDRRRNL